MDFHLKQWRNQQQEQEQEQEHEQQHESEEQQHSAKMPKLDLQNSDPSSGYALPLFVPEPNTNNNSKMMSPFSESSSSTSAAPTRFPKMGSYFSVLQWQELELQALIFRYMLAGAAVPPELLQPIKKSLLLSHHPPSPYFFHHPLQHFPQFQPHALLQTGYWGRGAMDPEPTRCRRTDGKKWRCSRDVVAGQKYCERHVHRGRNRSRKPVENTTTATPTTTAAAAAGGGAEGGFALNNASTNTTTHTSSGGTHFALSGSSFSSSPSNDLLHLNHSEVSGSAKKSDSHILRPFFDDWPGKLQEPDNARSNAGSMNSATSLSISIRGNASSDVSLKLSTGNVESRGHQEGHANHGVQPQLNWPPGWATNQMASMGGPLAEALRSSSNSNSSPTSVLHQLPRSSLSETSFITT